MSKVTPRDVHLSQFIGSVFDDAQMEMFLQCLAITQYRMNEDSWTPFTWLEYCHKCDHVPIDAELSILEAMVDGGTVRLNDMGRPKSVYIAPGYLARDDKRYVLTDKLLKVMAPHATKCENATGHNTPCENAERVRVLTQQCRDEGFMNLEPKDRVFLMELRTHTQECRECAEIMDQHFELMLNE